MKETPLTCKTVEIPGIPLSDHNARKLEITNKTKGLGRSQNFKPLKYAKLYQCHMNAQKEIIEHLKKSAVEYYILRCVGGTKSG